MGRGFLEPPVNVVNPELIIINAAPKEGSAD
jgi:hypothetical protein